MLIIKNILSWIFDAKNRSLIVAVAFIVLLFFLFSTCNRANSLQLKIEKNKQEAQRATNNYEASLDTVKMYRDKEGNLIGQIQGYELTVGELNGKYANLLGNYEDLKNKPPITITKIVTVIKDSILNVNVNSSGDSTGGELTFKDSTFFAEGNWRNLSGTIPYTLNRDSDNPLVPGKGSFEIGQSLSLSTYLTKDKESGKIMINVETPYPGVTFSSIKGASILDDEKNKKMWKEARKTWGLGVNVGYGFSLAATKPSPYFGVGLSYSPKWLQWGK